jgi:putative MATE family efflux protein
MQLKESYDKKVFYSLMLSLAIPIALQHLIAISLNTVDTIMIGSFGEAAIAAVGICNRIYFFFTLVTFGIYSGMSIFTAQYWGSKDIVNVKKMLGMQWFLGAVVAVIFVLSISLYPNVIISWFIKDTTVIQLGKSYIRIAVFSYFFMASSFSVSFTLRSLGIVRIPLAINVISVLLNTILNWIFIFGHFGFEATGVRGAAIATLLARIAEFLFYGWYLFKYKNNPLTLKLSDLFLWNYAMMKEKLKVAFPVVVNEVIWSLGMTVTYIAYGRLGANSVAAVQIAYSVNGIFEALFFGIGNACAIMLGNEIGKERYELAEKYSKKFIHIIIIMGFVLGTMLFLTKRPIISFFDLQSETIIMLNNTLIVMACAMPLSMCSYLFVVGILRSGGDTKFCMILEIFSIWGYVVPIAFIAVLWFKIPVYWVIALINTEHILKLILLVPRYRSKKWLRNLVKPEAV